VVSWLTNDMTAPIMVDFEFSNGDARYQRLQRKRERLLGTRKAIAGCNARNANHSPEVTGTPQAVPDRAEILKSVL